MKRIELVRSTFAILLLILFDTGSVQADVAPSAAIDLLEQSTKAIQTYDLSLTVKRDFVAKAEVTGKSKPGSLNSPAVEWRSLRPGEKGTAQVHAWRQVRDARGRRHVEQFDSRGNVEAVLTFDGEIKRSYNDKTKQGYLGPHASRFLQEDEDYVNFYSHAMGQVPLASLLRSRSGTCQIEDNEGRGRIVLDSPPEEGGLAQFGYRVWLDPEHGLLPSQIEVRRKEPSGETVLSRRIAARKFTSLEDGGWAPIEILVTTFVSSGPLKGTPSQQATATVDVTKSKWNRPLDDSLFTIAFPPGTSMLDDLRRITFVTGSQQREANLDRLVKQAKNLQSNIPSEQPLPEATNWLAWLLIALNIVLVLALVAFVWYRRFRRGSLT